MLERGEDRLGGREKEGEKEREGSDSMGAGSYHKERRVSASRLVPI